METLSTYEVCAEAHDPNRVLLVLLSTALASENRSPQNRSYPGHTHGTAQPIEVQSTPNQVQVVLLPAQRSPRAHR